jgi:hypothetical protein
VESDNSMGKITDTETDLLKSGENRRQLSVRGLDAAFLHD